MIKERFEDAYVQEPYDRSVRDTGQRRLCGFTTCSFRSLVGHESKEIEALGVVLSAPKDSKCGVDRGARNLPKMLDDTEAVSLCFGFNDKLWQIFSVSKTFEHDDTSFQVKPDLLN